MKKAFFLALLMVTAVLAFAQSGVIKELTGEVELKPAGASAFVPATAGATVARDTVVSTGFKGTAIIAVGSSVITVRPLTRLTLAEIQTTSTTENINVNLQAGRVKVDVKPPAGTKANFTVQSPSATASVRGTSFDFDTVNLKTYEGKVSFSGKFGAPMMVHAGGVSFVGRDGKAVDPTTAGIRNLQPPSIAEGVNVHNIGDSTGGSSIGIDVGYIGTDGDIGIDVGYK